MYIKAKDTWKSQMSVQLNKNWVRILQIAVAFVPFNFFEIFLDLSQDYHTWVQPECGMCWSPSAHTTKKICEMVGVEEGQVLLR